ncbi:hypothetical protein CFS9_05470 [Flavobacterium sp. CFS9]|uniref:PH domain-containing protein n=1 Tax=Flavobacterium sp. CFS9 TaxID=3143118 RepID=A0AAT9GXD8_9FLAO
MPQIKSRFKILVLFLVSYLTLLPILVVYLSYVSPVAGMVLPVLFLLFIAFFWLTIFRTRAFKVIFTESGLEARSYFGIGKGKVYGWSELDGFVTVFESGKLGISESVFILEKGKRVASISSFYHSNFDKLKISLNENLADLGLAKNTFKEANRELFK